MTESFFGAAQAEWKQAEQSGLAPWLLPVVSNITLPISPRSKLQTPGKTPSRKNQNGQIAGIPEWTTAPAALLSPPKISQNATGTPRGGRFCSGSPGRLPLRRSPGKRRLSTLQEGTKWRS